MNLDGVYPTLMFPPNQSQSADPDAPIRSTDNDASLARLSAVKKGYLQDQFVKTLVPRAHLQPTRPPLINIGTYVRSQGIDLLVEEWLELAKQSGQKAQVVSLGAGSDTRFWRIEVSLIENTIQRPDETTPVRLGNTRTTSQHTLKWIFRR